MLIPTPGCLLQSINGSLKFAYLVSILRTDKTLGLYHIQLFLNVTIKERRFDIHLPNFIIKKMQQLLTKSSQTLDLLPVRKYHRSQLLEFVGTLSRQVELYKRLCYHQRLFLFENPFVLDCLAAVR